MTVTRENALATIVRMAADNVSKIDARFAGRNLQVVFVPLTGGGTEVYFTDDTGKIKSPSVTFSGDSYPWPHGEWSGPLAEIPD